MRRVPIRRTLPILSAVVLVLVAPAAQAHFTGDPMHTADHTRDGVDETIGETRETVEQTVACVHEPPTGPAPCRPPDGVCDGVYMKLEPAPGLDPMPRPPLSFCNPGSDLFQTDGPSSPASDAPPTAATTLVGNVPAQDDAAPPPTMGLAPEGRVQAAGDLPPATPGTDPVTPWLLAAALVGAPLVLFLYRRLSRDEILDNETRRIVHGAVRDEPGRTAAEIADRTDLCYTTVRYHLRLLEEFDEVVTRRDGRRIRYFLNHGRYGRIHRRLLALAADDSRRRILSALARDGPLRTGELADRADIAPSTASHHLARLDDGDLVDRTRRANEVHYDLPDRVATVARRLLG